MSVISAVHELGLGPAPRVHACMARTKTPEGLPVECGRTPGHTGDHATSSLSYRWAQPHLSAVS